MNPLAPRARLSAANEKIVERRWLYWHPRAEVRAAKVSSSISVHRDTFMNLYRDQHRMRLSDALTRRIPLRIIVKEELDDPLIGFQESIKRLTLVTERRRRTQARRTRHYRSKEATHASRT